MSVVPAGVSVSQRDGFVDEVVGVHVLNGRKLVCVGVVVGAPFGRRFTFSVKV